MLYRVDVVVNVFHGYTIVYNRKKNIYIDTQPTQVQVTIIEKKMYIYIKYMKL